MRTGIACGFGLALAVAGAAAAAPPAPVDDPAFEPVAFGRFGPVRLLRTTVTPEQVLLFVSGDGGWDQDAVALAKALGSLDSTLVVGIDFDAWRSGLEKSREGCVRPADDLEELSQAIQKKLGFPRYVQPVLVGHSAGATMVYAALAQATPNTFRGGIGLAFEPQLDVGKPLCKGEGLPAKAIDGRHQRLGPARRLASPFVALHGGKDALAPAEAVGKFLAPVAGAELVVLPRVGHGFHATRAWLPRVEAAIRAFPRPRHEAAAPPPPPPAEPPAGAAGAGATPPATPPAEVADLPLIEVPAAGSGPPSDFFVVVLSGDGGWAGIDREIAAVLAGQGIPVVGLDSLQYFWTARTAATGGADLGRIVAHYQARWKRPGYGLVGYSRGADVLPAFAARLPAELSAGLRGLAFLGLSATTNYEFHVSDWWGGSGPRLEAVAPEVEKLRGLPMLCVKGSDEDDSLCTRLPAGLVETAVYPGGHHFGGDYDGIATRIVRLLARPAGPGKER